MAIRNLTNLDRGIPPGRRVMGLDLGAKTIGLALSDASRMISSPMETLKRSKFKIEAKTLAALVAEHEVAALVIGLPINMDGSEGPACQSARQFAANFNQVLDIDIAFWDERLSTVAVTRTLIEADVSRARRAKLVDKMAAAYILQGALDAMRTGPPGKAPD